MSSNPIISRAQQDRASQASIDYLDLVNVLTTYGMSLVAAEDAADEIVRRWQMTLRKPDEPAFAPDPDES